MRKLEEVDARTERSHDIESVFFLPNIPNSVDQGPSKREGLSWIPARERGTNSGLCRCRSADCQANGQFDSASLQAGSRRSHMRERVQNNPTYLPSRTPYLIHDELKSNVRLLLQVGPCTCSEGKGGMACSAEATIQPSWRVELVSLRQQGDDE